MAELINGSIIILGTLACTCGINFYIREKEMGRLRVYIMLLGEFAGFWCLGFGFMGMYVSATPVLVSKAVAMFSVVGYLAVMFAMVLELISVPKKRARLFTILFGLYSLSDFIMIASPAGHEFVRVNGRTAYYYLWETFEVRYHEIYVAAAVIILMTVGVVWLLGRNTKQNRSLILVVMASHVCLMASISWDTVFPLFRIPSFPGSCYGIAFSYLIFWYVCVHNNALSITVQNLSSYVYQSMNANILVFDMDKKLYMANDSSLHFFGLEKAAGQKLAGLFEVDEEDADDFFEKAVSGETDEWKAHTRHGKKSCSMRVTVAKSRGGRPYCLLLFVYDLTEEEEVQEELRAANQAKSDFLSNMSHEIRTPINAIIGMNEMILRETKEVNTLEYASSVQSSSVALLAIINDILDISKIESGKIEIIPTDYELPSLLHDCYNMIIAKA